MKERTAIHWEDKVAARVGIPLHQVRAAMELLEEGATVPFIARYRKDRTGALDEVQIQGIEEARREVMEMEKRRAYILETIENQGKLTEELENQIRQAESMARLEDLYLPYKPRRRTRAQKAREWGLEPLALLLMDQKVDDLEKEAQPYIREELPTVEKVLAGARDIVAEKISEDPGIRDSLRRLYEDLASLKSKVLEGKEEEGAKYRDYFDFSELIRSLPSHRILAIMRGFMEGVLRMEISPPEEQALARIAEVYLPAGRPNREWMEKAIKESYQRLLQPSLESEFRQSLKQKADEEATEVFAENLRQLLLSPPLGSRRILAIDPGIRTGSKLVCLDEKGDLIHSDLIYVLDKGERASQAAAKVRDLVSRHRLEAIAIGDGTAGRETEQFIRDLDLGLPVFLVNEDGASIYSASPIAREEFPDQDITVRGAVSIGRRLMDPLAELVKIDPKSIGVGQYQHDVNPTRLKEKLDQTVVHCVNAVGVNLNTASRHLLSYVSGIGPSLASSLVAYRKEIGKFRSRKQLLEVPKFGEKTFEQAAGFLRVTDGEHILDKTAVHPESYALAERMAADLQVSLDQLLGNDALLDKIDLNRYLDAQTGMHTLKDLVAELRKPGIDPRPMAEAFEFAQVFRMEDLHTGMILPGIVSNITRFGAFVDIGVKQDGLVHVSEMAYRYIKDPSEVVKLNQKVTVKVLEVDFERQRISLSMKQAKEGNSPASPSRGRAKKAKGEENRTVDEALVQLKSRFRRN